MNIAAYCRVSTDKSDQLNSLEAQKGFFAEFAEKNGHNLVRVYADEGISGTKVKNRHEFQQLMKDARHGMFEMVVVKDISRFARNTVDFLQSIRTLKELNIETVFLTANQKVLGNSEFVLTIFAALAQEESANTSKRIKFGKRINAERGRVPNQVYGYDKTIGELYSLTINEREADIVKEIYRLYLNEGYGALKIASILNNRNLRTKRGNVWSQNAICRILTNPIYIGKVVNGKEEVRDFLTGERETKDESEWLVSEHPEMRIISDEDFSMAQKILADRHDAFNIKHERQSNRHLFSTLIRCSECGYSFRRSVYRGDIRWVCSGRNSYGTGSCPNKTIIHEDELKDALKEYFTGIIANKAEFAKDVSSRFKAQYDKLAPEAKDYDEMTKKLSKLENKAQKYMDMYVDELITREMLNTKLSAVNDEISRVKNDLKLLDAHSNTGERLEEIISDTVRSIERSADVDNMSNTQLKKIIQKITIDKDGNIDVYLNLIDELGLSDDFLVSDINT